MVGPLDIIIEEGARQMRVRILDSINLDALSGIIKFAEMQQYSKQAVIRSPKKEDESYVALYIADAGDLPF